MHMYVILIVIVLTFPDLDVQTCIKVYLECHEVLQIYFVKLTVCYLE